MSTLGNARFLSWFDNKDHQNLEFDNDIKKNIL